MKKQRYFKFKKRAPSSMARYVPVVFSSLAAITSYQASAEQYFNPAFLSSDPSAVADLSRFNKEGGQAPGVYRVELYINNASQPSRDVNFKSVKEVETQDNKNVPVQPAAVTSSASEDGTGLTPFFTVKELDGLGLNIKSLPGFKDLQPTQSVDIVKTIPGVKATFDFEKQRLDLSIPQIVMKSDARGYIPPEQWDEGINALLLNYNFNGNETTNDGQRQSDKFLSLESGINLGPWRLRDSASWSSNDSGDSHSSEFQHISTYVERAIIPLKAELVVGDTSTDNDVFDSLPLRGVILSSDDNMLPDSLRGFAPTIRGIAKSNAKVTIKQNSYVIYQTYVAPGAFEINDLFPTSSSGDLQVLVEESNGSINSYNVPYAGVPILQREGRVKYAISAGQYRNGGDQQNKTDFEQATVLWGLPGGITVYGGTQFSSDYRAFALGMGKNLGDLGAVSVDITQANSTLADDSKHQGQSVRFLYAKTLNEFGTNFQLLGYRYSTEGFYTLSETTYKRMSGYNDTVENDDKKDGDDKLDYFDYFDYYNLNFTKRGKVQANISQQLGTGSNIYASASKQSYWHTDETDTLLQIGFNSMAWDATYTLAYSYNKSQDQSEADKIVSLNVSVPLSKWLPGQGSMPSSHTVYATYNNSSDNHGNMTQQAGISGTMLETNNLSYNISQGYGNNGAGNSGSVNANYRGGSGNSNIGYNYSSGYQQLNYGLSGGIVAHRHGVTFSQPLGDTNVLVEAPGADNVAVQNNAGVKTDWRGYAVVPYASTYRQNRIGLDTTTLNNHTDVEDAVVDVVPTKGAIVRAKFEAHVGIKALLTLTNNGKPLPFGTTVSRTDTEAGGIVGDEGQVYMAGLPLIGTLKSQWGAEKDQACQVDYSLPEDSLDKAITYVNLDCK